MTNSQNELLPCMPSIGSTKNDTTAPPTASTSRAKKKYCGARGS